MKKLFYFLAMAAVVLGMASCGDGNEPHLKNFKVEFGEITQTSAEWTIYPGENIERYRWYYTPLHTRMKLILPDQGTTDIEYKKIDVYPDTEYRIALCPLIPNGAGYDLGESEHVTFKTPDWPKTVELENELDWTGDVTPDEQGFRIIAGDGGNQHVEISIVADGLTGKFTKNNLDTDGDPIYQVGYAASLLYDIEIEGIRDTNKNRYIYTGWWRISMPDLQCAYRQHFKLTCQKEDPQ